MTLGVGNGTAAEELQRLSSLKPQHKAIEKNEFELRIENACGLMREQGLSAIYLNAGTNLYYFTGTRWGNSERMVGALLTRDGELHYISPTFEISTLEGYMLVKGNVHGWQEHESPYALFAKLIDSLGMGADKIGLDESCPFFISDGLHQACPQTKFVNAKSVTANCRMRKSTNELALMKTAMNMTVEVHKSAAKILRDGISTGEVTDFIDQAHRAVGANKGSYFCIVLFGEDSAYPHGVSNPKTLDAGDMVLIDTGYQLEGYNSDITRTYVFGEPKDRDREVWDHEKQSQAIAFAAAKLGQPCGSVDLAARKHLESLGYGPDYQSPGLVHRTGHGIGLDIHEWPYLVGSDQTPLDVGMCFSNEPMISIPGEFGVRLEDHFYMTESGPAWFTEPSHSVDDPFGLQA